PIRPSCTGCSTGCATSVSNSSASTPSRDDAMQPELASAPNAARWTPDEEIVAALRAGDEHAFHDLFQRHCPTMKRVARGYVHSDAVAEEIVQETWLAILTGIDRFEGRSALGTW